MLSSDCAGLIAPTPYLARNIVKAIPVASLVFSVVFAASALGAAPNYKVIDRIKVGDGGYDYATYDPATGRVLIARTDYTTVIDTKTGKLSQLTSAAGGHMAMPIPGTNLLLPQAKGTILIVDGSTDKTVAKLPGGKGPDGAVYDPFSELVFVMNHNGGDATVVDPAVQQVVATIPVGGVLEFPVSDGAGKVFVNVQDKNEIAVIDVATLKTTAHYKLAGCEAPTGIDYVPAAKLLISSCGENGVVKVIRADTGAEVASLSIALGADAVIYDENRKVASPTQGPARSACSTARPSRCAIPSKLARIPTIFAGMTQPNAFLSVTAATGWAASP
jgi:DNA-binding beta-propeller fold protein YncE